jgi:hypothetical protein
MERIKFNKYFYLDELVDPQTYLLEFDNGLSKLDKQLLRLLEVLREKYGKPLTVNNWWDEYEKHKDNSDVLNYLINSNSIRKYSGFRSILCPIGAKFSAHKQGKGIDIKGNPKELFKLIEDNSQLFYDLGLRRLEDTKITTTWLHLDTWAKNNVKGIEVVDLKRVVKILPLK